MNKTKDLTQGRPAKVLAAFALPVFIGNLFQQLYTTVDSVIVAQNTGAGKQERALTGYRRALAINTVIAFVTAALIFVVPTQLMRLFLAGDTPRQVFITGKDYLRAMMIYVFFMGILFAGDALLKGSGDVNIMIYIAAVSTMTKIAASYIGMQLWGVNGVFFGAVCSWFAEMVAVCIRIVSGRWKTAARQLT